jgi:hypothetical protein
MAYTQATQGTRQTIPSTGNITEVYSSVLKKVYHMVFLGIFYGWLRQKTKNSVALVRELTIPTERSPLIDEVGVSFCGQRLSRGQRDRSLRPYSRFSRPESLFFLSSSSSVVLTSPREPVSDPLLLRKAGSSGNRTRTSGYLARNSDKQNFLLNICSFVHQCNTFTFYLLLLVDMFRPHTAIFKCYSVLPRNWCSVMPIFAYVMLPAMC